MHLELKLLDSVCRPKLREIIERCLNPDLKQRFADAETLQRALGALMVEG